MASVIRVAAELDTIDTGYEEAWLNYGRYIGWASDAQDNRQTIHCNTLLPGSTPVIDNIKDIYVSVKLERLRI